MTQNYEGCFFCEVTNPHAVEEHHIVPERYNGSDEPENLVDLCGSCHNKIENRMYTDRFYERLGVAVDELERVSDQMSGGIEVDARNSKDRKIPSATDHVMFEEWLVTVYISDVRDGNVPNTVAGLIDDRGGEIIEQYEQRLEENMELEQEQRNEPDLPQTDGVSPVQFLYDHELVAEYPVLMVKNPRENWIDWEHEDAPTLERAHVQKDKQARVGDNYPDYYRMHCGYCHTVYTQHQHSDMARHLRVRHGIEEPYQANATAIECNTETDPGL